MHLDQATGFSAEGDANREGLVQRVQTCRRFARTGLNGRSIYFFDLYVSLTVFIRDIAGKEDKCLVSLYTLDFSGTEFAIKHKCLGVYFDIL